MEHVQKWWMSYNFQGYPSFILVLKLRAMKMDLTKWNEEDFGNIGKQKKNLLVGIRDLNIIAEGRPLFDAKMWRKNFLGFRGLFCSKKFVGGKS